MSLGCSIEQNISIISKEAGSYIEQFGAIMGAIKKCTDECSEEHRLATAGAYLADNYFFALQSLTEDAIDDLRLQNFPKLGLEDIKK